MAKFRKKPVVIEAVQFTKETFVDVIVFMEQKERSEVVKSINKSGDRFYDYQNICEDKGLKIPTLEGEMTASLNDWVIKGVNGEFYPCKPDIFEKTYEAVTD